MMFKNHRASRWLVVATLAVGSAAVAKDTRTSDNALTASANTSQPKNLRGRWDSITCRLFGKTCYDETDNDTSGKQFVDVTARSTIQVTTGYQDRMANDEVSIILPNGAAAGDIDGDGLVDLVIVRGDMGPMAAMRPSSTTSVWSRNTSSRSMGIRCTPTKAVVGSAVREARAKARSMGPRLFQGRTRSTNVEGGARSTTELRPP